MDLILDIVGLAAVLEFEITAHRTQGDRACRAPSTNRVRGPLASFPKLLVDCLDCGKTRPVSFLPAGCGMNIPRQFQATISE